MVNAHAIYIYETLNPGSIVNIWGGDCKGSWQKMWNGSDRPTYSHAPRQFGPPIDCLPKPISMVRIYFNSYQIKSYSAIDAVCLLGTLEDNSKDTKEGPIFKLILEKKLHLRMMTFEDQLDKTERKMQLNLSDDGYFNSLPREIILFILSHLDFRSLIQCCQVSKNFRDIASDPLLYIRLELKYSLWHKVSNATLKSVFRKTKLLKYLDISHCGNYGRLTPVTLRTFIYARGAKLTNLLLQNCHSVTKIVLVSIGNFQL